MEISPVGPGLTAPEVPESAPAPLRDGQVLVGKVLGVEGKMARVDVAGRILDVQTAVPLSPGDELRVKVAMGAGDQVRLQVMALRGKESLTSDAHIAALLEKMGLTPDKASIAAARALLAETGTVDPRSVRDLAKLSTQFKTPEEQAAATYLVARNLPATTAAVALVAGRPGDPATAGKRVADRLKALERGAPQLLEALAILELSGEDDAAALGEALVRLAKGFNPPEAEILAYLRDRHGDLADRLSRNLVANLERYAADPAVADAPRQAARELASELRFQQLPTGAANPAEVKVPVVFGGATGELTVQKWDGNAKDPAGHARVLLELDMDALGHVGVDLMYSKGHVGGRFTVPDADTADFLAGRLDELQGGLGKAGIGVNHLEVGVPRETAAREVPRGRFDLKL